MALPKIAEARQKSDQEIVDRILEIKKDLFQLRFEKGARRLEQPHQFKHLKHELAQLLTVERERQLNETKAE